MLTSYRGQRWEDALAALEKIETLRPILPVTELTRLYRDRVLAYQTAPPAQDWDGVFVATSK